MKYSTIAIFLACLIPLPSLADQVSLLDFSNANDGATHSTDSGFSSTSPYTSSTGDWVLTWDDGSVSTDSTTNEFTTTVGGIVRVQDWGGVGTLTKATPWTANSGGTLDIEGIAATIGGSNAFNVTGEGITWFYSINGGSNVEQFIGVGSDGVDVSGDVSHTFSNININAGDQIAFGFSVNVNGSGDGAEISSMTLNFSSIPEPTSLLLFGTLASLGLARSRRR